MTAYTEEIKRLAVAPWYNTWLAFARFWVQHPEPPPKVFLESGRKNKTITCGNMEDKTQPSQCFLKDLIKGFVE